MDALGCSEIKVLGKLLFVTIHVSGSFVVNYVFHAPGSSIGKYIIKVEIRGRPGEVEIVFRYGDVPCVVPAFEQHCVDVVFGRKIYVTDCIFGSCAVAWILSPGVQAQMHTPPYAHVLLRLYP